MPRPTKRYESIIKLLELYQEEHKDTLLQISGFDNYTFAKKLLKDKIHCTKNGLRLSEETKILITKYSKVCVSKCHLICSKTGREFRNPKLKQI